MMCFEKFYRLNLRDYKKATRRCWPRIYNEDSGYSFSEREDRYSLTRP